MIKAILRLIVPFDVNLAELGAEGTLALENGVLDAVVGTGAIERDDVESITLSQDDTRRARRAENAPVKAEIVFKPDTVDPTAVETAVTTAINSGSFKVEAVINGETISATITEAPVVESATVTITPGEEIAFTPALKNEHPAGATFVIAPAAEAKVTAVEHDHDGDGVADHSGKGKKGKGKGKAFKVRVLYRQAPLVRSFARSLVRSSLHCALTDLSCPSPYPPSLFFPAPRLPNRPKR